MFLDTTGIIKARRIYCCSQPANSYLKSERKVRSRERLGGLLRFLPSGSRMSILTSRGFASAGIAEKNHRLCPLEVSTLSELADSLSGQLR